MMVLDGSVESIGALPFTNGGFPPRIMQTGAVDMVVATPRISLREIEAEIRRSTGNRVRGLAVEREDQRVVIRGLVPTWHTKQLALHAVLDLIEDDDLAERLTVG